MPLFRPAQTGRSPLLPFMLFAAYASSAAIAYLMTVGTGGLAVLWINNGLLAAALLLLPRGPAIALAAGSVVVDFLGASSSGSPPGQAILIAGCDLAESVTAALLIRRVGGAALDMTSFRRFRLTTLYAVLPATLLASTVGALLSARLFGNPFGALWLTWFGGDFLGMMIGLPATLLLSRFRRFDQGEGVGRTERVAWLAGAVLLGGALFAVTTTPFIYLFFPFGLLMVLRLSPPFALLGVLGFAAAAAGSTALGHGPIAATVPDINHRILHIQLYLASIQFCALVLISVLTQRARAQAALNRALEMARETRHSAIEAAGAKGRFLAVMSHEMRTPLNGITGYAQMLGSREDLPSDVRAQIRTINDSSGVLLGLINDVLDYSRNETGALQLVNQPFRLNEMAARCLDVVRPLTTGRDIALTLDSAIADDSFHLGDERRLTQILLNLLGNAAKFTEEGGIALRIERLAAAPDAGDSLVISVSDTGIGIPEGKLARVFDPFSQVDASDRRSHAGAGLGLAICQSLIGRMDGEIGVESEEGKGSRFWISLTLPRATAPQSQTPATCAATQDQALRALVADDHAVNRQVARLMLEAAGIEVTTVENGALAVEALSRDVFDVVFMDLHMPVMDGLTACRQIRSLAGPAAATPVIAMTAAAMPEDVDRCLAAGMSAHVSKPIRQEELVQAALAAHPVRQPAAAAA